MAEANGVVRKHKDDRDRTRALVDGIEERRSIGDDHFRVHGDQLGGVGRLKRAAGPAILDFDIAAFYPAKGAKALPECGDARLSLGFAFLGAHQHADPPYAPGLLRRRGERHTRYRSADKTEKFPAPRVQPPDSNAVRLRP